MSASGDNGWLCSREVPTKERIRCAEAVGSLFGQLFAPRCSPHLSHLSETSLDRSIMFAICGGMSSRALRRLATQICPCCTMLRCEPWNASCS